MEDTLERPSLSWNDGPEPASAWQRAEQLSGEDSPDPRDSSLLSQGAFPQATQAQLAEGD